MKRTLLIFFSCLWLIAANIACADSVDDLKAKISSKSSEVSDLEQQIADLNSSVQKTVGEKQTLAAELKRIDASKKQLDTQISLTGKKISLAELNISKLESDIADKGTHIASGQDAVGGSLRMINVLESTTLPEIILSGDSLSSIWDEVSNVEDLQAKMVSHINSLQAIKAGLESDKKSLEGERKNLILLNTELGDQKKIVLQNIADKNRLIKDTNNKEVNYRKLLADTQARKAAVESELAQYQSQLSVTINPESLPGIGSKILSWPLAAVGITQYFGDTEFSKTQPIYNGHGHPGIDLRASIGTVITAPASGVVEGVGDTDPVCYKASYGKWIMLDHGNGLATLYGHLSLIKVSAGDTVNRGDIIGYTGSTGYATGPHLHFGVVATAAVKIGQLKSKVPGCGTYTIPLGPFNGYLNPLSYL